MQSYWRAQEISRFAGVLSVCELLGEGATDAASSLVRRLSRFGPRQSTLIKWRWKYKSKSSALIRRPPQIVFFPCCLHLLANICSTACSNVHVPTCTCTFPDSRRARVRQMTSRIRVKSRRAVYIPLYSSRKYDRSDCLYHAVLESLLLAMLSIRFRRWRFLPSSSRSQQHQQSRMS